MSNLPHPHNLSSYDAIKVVKPGIWKQIFGGVFAVLVGNHSPSVGGLSKDSTTAPRGVSYLILYYSHVVCPALPD
jgi:hypothetical protein